MHHLYTACLLLELVFLDCLPHLLHRLDFSAQPSNTVFMDMEGLLLKGHVEVRMIPVFDIRSSPGAEFYALVIQTFGRPYFVNIQPVRIHVEVMYGVLLCSSDTVSNVYSLLKVGQRELVQSLLHRQTANHAADLREFARADVNILHSSCTFSTNSARYPSATVTFNCYCGLFNSYYIRGGLRS